MKTSVEQFRTKFTEAILNFVWRQWSQIGVAGSVKKSDPWVIDVEPLLAFTSEIARHDARMFDEVMDWLVVNGEWINAQRLSTILHQDEVGDKAVVGALAFWMMEKDKSMKWRGLAARMKPYSRTPAEPLLWGSSTRGAAPHKRPDDHFRRYGLLRPPIQTRGLTQPVNMKEPAALAFKCRAVFGIGIRADAMAFLMASEGTHARRMAEILGYNHMRVQAVLVGLEEAGVVAMRPVGRTKQYRLDRDKWWSVLMGERQPCPCWVNWRSLIRGLSVLWRATWALDALRADDYIFSSKMRSAMRSARNDLHAGGLGIEVEDDKGLVAEAYLRVFLRDIEAMLRILGA
ncbi:MAG: helix-turn-helix transcriptional regulator [Lentisphaerae bacterium]|nr:helix-turn-helix transcriptional regulator [Lentisphaerota bacterium]